MVRHNYEAINRFETDLIADFNQARFGRIQGKVSETLILENGFFAEIKGGLPVRRRVTLD
jgi:hypothetical protein